MRSKNKLSVLTSQFSLFLLSLEIKTRSESHISRRLKQIRLIVIVSKTRRADSARIQIILNKLPDAAAVENCVKNGDFARARRAAALRQRSRCKICIADQCLAAQFVSFVKEIEKNDIRLD